MLMSHGAANADDPFPDTPRVKQNFRRQEYRMYPAGPIFLPCYQHATMYHQRAFFSSDFLKIFYKYFSKTLLTSTEGIQNCRFSKICAEMTFLKKAKFGTRNLQKSSRFLKKIEKYFCCAEKKFFPKRYDKKRAVCDKLSSG